MLNEGAPGPGADASEEQSMTAETVRQMLALAIAMRAAEALKAQPVKSERGERQ